MARGRRRRADAAAARARVAALAKVRDLAERQRTRDVTIGLQAEHAPAFSGSIFGLTASIPLLLNNDYTGDIARARAEYDQAVEHELRVRGAIQADIERRAAQVETALDRARRIAVSALPEARRAAEGMEFAFARGAAALTNRARKLKAEMYVIAEVAVPPSKALRVPSIGLFLLEDRYYAFIEEAPGRFVRRAVQAELATLGSMRVLAGIAPGEKVVADGALLMQQLLTQKATAPAKSAQGSGKAYP